MSGATSSRLTYPDLPAEAARIVAELKRTVAAGETHWFLALMQAVREWPLPQEKIGTRTYRYLVGGEAFDWLLLAERLTDEIEDLIPDEEREALLFHGQLPEDVDENDVERLLGAKHRAHLNFVYGVRVEEALQLAVVNEVHKERFASHIWEKTSHADDEAFQRLYGATRPELFAEFSSTAQDVDSKRRARKASRSARPEPPLSDHPEPPLSAHPEVSKEGAGHNGGSAGDNGSSPRDNGHLEGNPDVLDITLADLTEFTYWLFRRRVGGSEPARVASDTRKGVAMLQRLESLRRRAARVSS